MYDIYAPIHSFIALKRAVEAGEVPRPKVLPMLTLTDETTIRSPLIEGWLILYTGKPKIGKTELLSQTILNWQDEKSVLWFSEEGFSVWVEKTIRTPSAIIHNDFAFVQVEDNDTQWIQSTIKRIQPNVVVIDTIKLLGIEEENKPSEIRAALKPYYLLAHQKNITIILIHHDRKAVGTFGDQISGSNSFPATADVTMSIKRVSLVLTDTKRVVEVSGRADNTEFAYMLDKETGQMVILGDPANLKLAGLKTRIAAILTDDLLTTTMIRDIVVADGKGEASKASFSTALNQMAGDRECVRVPDISEGSMKRKTVYWLKKGDGNG